MGHIVPRQRWGLRGNVHPHARRNVSATMRTLLIDNYDSFTYNLYQLISEVNGSEPTVVRNDEAEGVLNLDHFDNVVISPGPGQPDRARDMGVSTALIAQTELPLLGVCLGHQGIVLGAGGTVERAAQARHGFLDQVTHDDRDLFAGLPQGFTVVRYHSLAARAAARDARGDRLDQRRGDHGRASSRAAAVGCAVPSRVGVE